MNPRTRQRSISPPSSAPITGPKSRALNMQLLVLIIGFILTARLFYLQIAKHSHYNKLAVAEHQKKFTIPATRGTLYFRDGGETVPAVLNATVYTLYADPREVDDPAKTARKIAGTLKLDADKLEKNMRNKSTSYSVLAKRLSKEQVDQLFKAKNSLRGVNVTPVPQRVYPEGSLGAQLLGFVNDEGIGQYGVESALNTSLSGKPGLLKAITDVNGVPLSLDDSTNIAEQPKQGQNTVLTVDRNIQGKAEEALVAGLKRSNATRGSVIVMDPSNGAVKAMANLPTFDPAKYYDVGDDAYQRFQNRVVSDQYEAGSVIKVLTVAAGLDAGVVSKDSRFNNTGSVRIDDATIKNVDQAVGGSRSMTDILKYSLNTGVVHILSELGGGNINAQARERLYGYFTDRYGFGDVTGVEQGGEGTGSIYGPRTVQGNNVRYSNMAFGQGMGVTMVQVASAFSSVINGGNYYTPHMTEGTLEADGSVRSKKIKPQRTGVVNQATSNAILEMTRTALRETSVVSHLIRPGYNVGGKTGTSQTIDPTTGKYTDTTTVGSYLGYGGDSKPRYVIMVRVDDPHTAGFSGAAAAAPIFADISNWMLDYYAIKPM